MKHLHVGRKQGTVIFILVVVALVSFTDWRLRHVNLNYAAWRAHNDLRGMNFDSIDLRVPNLDHVNLQRASMRSSVLSGQFFGMLDHCDLDGADLSFCKGPNFGLIYCTLRSANLQNADLRSCSVLGADLRGANLANSDLEAAYMCGANLIGASLTDANLVDAVYDDTTRWPIGFEPRRHGCRHVSLQGKPDEYIITQPLRSPFE